MSFDLSTIPDAPVNTVQRDTSERAIQEAVDYAFRVGRSHKEKREMWGGSLDGISALEIGPGIDFGSTLFMACFGTSVAVADHWLAQWQDDFHRPLYTALEKRISEVHPEADTTPIHAVLEAGDYPPEIIRLIPEMADTLESVPDGSFDYVVSNAVFEHIPRLRRACAQMMRISKPGALHIHQVDMRDHRTFDRPLEYLLLVLEDEEKFLSLSEYHLGSLRRASEYEAAFRGAGFEVLSNYVNLRSEPDYMQDFLARLNRLERARYRDWPRDDIDILGVTYALRRPA
jgi:hypothetical protein